MSPEEFRKRVVKPGVAMQAPPPRIYPRAGHVVRVTGRPRLNSRCLAGSHTDLITSMTELGLSRIEQLNDAKQGRVDSKLDGPLEFRSARSIP